MTWMVFLVALRWAAYTAFLPVHHVPVDVGWGSHAAHRATVPRRAVAAAPGSRPGRASSFILMSGTEPSNLARSMCTSATAQWAACTASSPCTDPSPRIPVWGPRPGPPHWRPIGPVQPAARALPTGRWASGRRDGRGPGRVPPRPVPPSAGRPRAAPHARPPTGRCELGPDCGRGCEAGSPGPPADDLGAALVVAQTSEGPSHQFSPLPVASLAVPLMWPSTREPTMAAIWTVTATPVQPRG